MAQSLEELVRQSGDLLKEVDWNDLLAAVGAIVEGTATVHVDPGESLPEAVDKLPAEGGEIALRAGTHELTEPLLISNRARIALTGAGASTVIRCATGEAAIVLDGCREMTLTRLRVEGGTPAAGSEAARHINGAVTVLGGSDMTMSECTLACPDAATPRAQSCLTVRPAAGGAQADRLRIDRCRFEIGASQIGALLVDPVTVTVERNHAFLRRGALPNTAADAGILVAGANVGTVRVLDNVIDTAIRGIHIGVSRGSAAPAVAADVVLISGNVVTVFVPSNYKRDRHAVFVGNARSISILDTVATLRRSTLLATLRHAPVEGIRVYGSIGPFLLVRGSSLRGFNVGVRVVPLAAPSIATWVVSDTLADGAAQGVDAPATVEQQRNRPAPPVRKPGTPTRILLTPAVSSSATGAKQKITATVTDLAGLRVPSVSVRFSVIGANPKADTVVKSDASGVATFSYTGANQGTDIVGALVTSPTGDRRATATVTYLPPVPAKVVLSPAQGFGFKGQSLTFTATVLDAANQPRPGVAVRFKVSGANATSASATSDAQGQAKLTYAGTNVGTDQVTAFADVNNNGQQDVTDPFATASATFTLKEADRILVPNLIGLTKAGAQTALESVGLALGKVVTETTTTFAIRALTLFVVDQNPAAGSAVNPGSLVNITLSDVSDGPGGPVLEGI